MGIYHPGAPKEGISVAETSDQIGLAKLEQLWEQNFVLFNDDDRLAWEMFSDALKYAGSRGSGIDFKDFDDFFPNFVHIMPTTGEVLRSNSRVADFNLHSGQTPQIFTQHTSPIFNYDELPGVMYKMFINEQVSDEDIARSHKLEGYSHVAEMRRAKVVLLAPEYRDRFPSGQAYLLLVESRKMKIIDQSPEHLFVEDDLLAIDPDIKAFVFHEKDTEGLIFDGGLDDIKVLAARHQESLPKNRIVRHLSSLRGIVGFPRSKQHEVHDPIFSIEPIYIGGLSTYLAGVRVSGTLTGRLDGVSNDNAKKVIQKSQTINLQRLIDDLELIFSWSFDPDKHESHELDDDFIDAELEV